MGRLIYEGNSVYELDEEALLKRQKKQMEQFSDGKFSDGRNQTKADNNYHVKESNLQILKRKKKGTV